MFFVWVWGFAVSAEQELSPSLSTKTHSLQNKWGISRGMLTVAGVDFSLPSQEWGFKCPAHFLEMI